MNILEILKKKTKFVFFILIFAGVFAVFFVYFSKPKEKTRAAGESVELKFEPSRLEGQPQSELTNLVIQGRPLNQNNEPMVINVRAYKFNISFDKNRLSIISLNPPSNCNFSSELTNIQTANETGNLVLACINLYDATGMILSNNFNTLATIRFRTKENQGNTQVTIQSNAPDTGFQRIKSDGTLELVPISNRSNLALPVEIGNPSPTNTPTPTYTPTPTLTSTPTPTHTPTPTQSSSPSTSPSGLQPPGRLSGSCNSPQGPINLRWEASSNASGYYVSRKRGNEDWNYHYSYIPHPTLSFSDSNNIDWQRTFSYNVKSCNSQNDCPGNTYTNQVNVNCPTPTPGGGSSPSATPTPTRPANQTPTQSPGAPTITPSVTPGSGSSQGRNINVRLKIKLQGVTTKPSPGLDRMKASITLAREGGFRQKKENVEFVARDSGFWETVSPVQFTNLPNALSNYYFLIKGEKHIQKKICDPNPIETWPGTYACDQGKINLNNESMEFDFSRVFLLVGDLPRQDGIVNSYDFSLVRNNLNSRDPGVIAIADVNYDGIVDSQDYSLIISALSIRTDEGETTTPQSRTLIRFFSVKKQTQPKLYKFNF